MDALNAEATRALRRVYPRVLARTLALTRSLPDAEDAVQEAMLRALSNWTQGQAPDSPEAWLVRVAGNVHRDRLRRGKRVQFESDVLDTLARMSPWVQIAVGAPDVARGWKDELLRLLFACCHPSLDAGESAALCLATVVGLSTAEVSAAFMTEPRTMEQRLSRARRRLRERGDWEGETPEASGDRIEPVLMVVHLLFSEGYWSAESGPPIRAELCRLALGLAHSLRSVYPDHPEVLGLLALLMFHDARRPARLDAQGQAIALPDQDRSLWDREAIRVAEALLSRALDHGAVGPFQLEAGIAAAHCGASCAEATPWTEIAELYSRLEVHRPTPAVRVNRCFALGQAGSPGVALELLRTVDASTYPRAHAVGAALHERNGDWAAASTAYETALTHAANEAEREHLARARARAVARAAEIAGAPGDAPDP